MGGRAWDRGQGQEYNGVGVPMVAEDCGAEWMADCT